MSLVKYGGNSRFVSAEPDSLIKIPRQVDPAEAACLAETYLSAFQVLHFGQSPASRYRKLSLKGKSLFIHGPVTSNFGRAIAQLAVDAGVENIYATTKPKHVQNLMSMGIVPLSPDPVDWWEDLTGNIDLFISIEEKVIPLHYKLLSTSGHVIFTGHGSDIAEEQDGGLSNKVACSRLRAERASKTHRFDLFKNWDENLPRCKKDLTYLLGLLQQRRIQPQIIDRIPLSKIARAQELVELKRHSGFLVCEPWLVSKSRVVSL